MRKVIILIFIMLCLLFTACEEKEKPKPEPVLSGEVGISFKFSKDEFTVGEVVCVGMTLNNGTGEFISVKDFPAKRFDLYNSDGDPVPRFQRTAFPMPPKMLLNSGEDSYSIVDVTGTFENFGPGMLSAGEYTLKVKASYYTGEDVRYRQNPITVTNEVKFRIVEPAGEAAEALAEVVTVLGGADAMTEMIGQRNIQLDESARAKAEEIAQKYTRTPIGARIFINHTGIWCKTTPIERYQKFFAEADVECPGCLHAFILDRLTQRFVDASERDKILDLAEEALKKFPPESEIGALVRQTFSFTMDGDRIIR